MAEQTLPELAAPGAGLPSVELFIGRTLFALKRFCFSRETVTAQFQREREVIRRLVRSSDESSRGERILIPRLRGLEDSSRYWSVWMTLDHLRITNSVFAMVMTSLAHGKVPQKKACTADVKPDPGVTAKVEAEYEDSCDRFLSAAASVADLHTSAKYAHPWFGPLDAGGWYALSAGHMRIHRAQLQSILQHLASR